MTLSFKSQLKSRFPEPWRKMANVYYLLRTRAQLPRWYLRKTHWGIELLRNALIDLRYGGYCGGRIPTRFTKTGAHGFTSADYCQLAKLFDPARGVHVSETDVVVDVGCGKGRVINFWLSRGVRGAIIGLELDPDIAEHARKRLKRYPNVRIVPGDALGNLPPYGTLFFLFNPFGAAVVEAFKNRFYELFGSKPVARILYYYCKYLDVFRNDDRFHVQELPFRAFYRAAVIRVNPSAGAPPSTSN